MKNVEGPLAYEASTYPWEGLRRSPSGCDAAPTYRSGLLLWACLAIYALFLPLNLIVWPCRDLRCARCLMSRPVSLLGSALAMCPACFQKVGASPMLSCLCSALSPLVESPTLGLPFRARWGPGSAHAAGPPRCSTPTSGTLGGGRLRNCCACTCALPIAPLSIRFVSVLSCAFCIVCDMHSCGWR